MELNVVPGLSLHVEPSVMIVPLEGRGRRGSPQGRPRHRREQHQGRGDGEHRLKVPAGWQVLPASQPVSLAAEGRPRPSAFTVTPPGGAGDREARAEGGGHRRQGAGPHRLRAVHAGLSGDRYPHIQRRHKVIPAETTVKVVDVGVAPGIKLGYVMGVGDLCRRRSDQLGVKASMIDADELAYGNLARCDTIMLGIRAYERREDLKAYNHRLIKYVNDGGTLIVQYIKTGGVQPGAVRTVSRAGEQQPRDRRNRAGADPREGASRVHLSEPDPAGRLGRLGAGARPLLPRREGREIHRPRPAPGSVRIQPWDERWGACRSAVWQGPVDLCRPSDCGGSSRTGRSAPTS